MAISVSGRPAYYFYHNALIRALFGLVDILGFSFFTSPCGQIKISGKILVVNLGGAGDLILSEPLLSALSSLTTDGVDLLCFPGQELSLLGLIKIHKVFYLELPWLGGHQKLGASLINLWRLSRLLRQENYLAAFDLKGDPILIFLLIISRVTYRLGFSNGGLGFLLTHPLSQPQHLSRSRIDLSLLAPLAGNFFSYDRPPRLPLLVNCNFLKLQTNYRPDCPVITIHTGASSPARLWPFKYWAELLNLLIGRYNITMIGGEQELQNFYNLPEQVRKSVINLCGRSWLESAQAIKNSDIFLGANSGPAHLAAALGGPVVSIFSAANDPNEWAPAGARVLVFYPACAGCEKSVCADLQCLWNITPTQVLAAVNDIVDYSGQDN